MHTTPLASVVITCFGKRDYTERCLHSLERCLGPSMGREIELVLVDNASPDDTRELLDRWRDRATVLALPENRNFSGGCNAGAEASRGDVVIFLNNDTVMEPGVLEELASTASEPGVGAAGPRMHYADGRLQHGGVLMIPIGHTTSPFHILHRHEGQNPAVRAVLELECVTGACLAVPRALFLELGGFDEEYRNGLEDVDLCLRIRMTGRRIVYRGDLTFLHDEGVTRRGLDDTPNQRRFNARWQGLLSPDTEIAQRTWASELSSSWPARTEPASSLVLAGPVLGIGPAADEARALLVGFERAGCAAVALDEPLSVIRPTLPPDVGEACRRGLSRQLPESALVLHVPEGPAMAATARPGVAMRVGRPGDAPEGRTAVGAAPGADDGRWVPPAIVTHGAVTTPEPAVAVHLPAHRPETARAILRALRPVPVPVRIVPSVGDIRVRDWIAELLPAAELLGPCGHDAEWEAVAASARVAVCLDPDDGYERRALVAAAAGAVPITDGRHRAAGAVLEDWLIAASPDTLTAAVCEALSREDGPVLAEIVRARCDPATVAGALLEVLVGEPATHAAGSAAR